MSPAARLGSRRANRGVTIERVEAVCLDGEGPSHFVRIGTKDETGLGGPVDATVASFALARLSPLLRGQRLSPGSPAPDRLATAHRHGSTGLAAVATGAVDCALWDLRGKLAGKPVFELIGGRRRETVPAYASMLGYELEDEAAPALALAAIESGFAGVKWALRGKPRDGGTPDVAALGRVREAIGGQAPLMADALCGWDFEHAAAWCRRAGPLGLTWLEDPLPARDLAGISRLAALGDVPLAGGEHGYGADEAIALLRFGNLAALLSDVSWCGISAGRRIVTACEDAGTPLCPHGAGLIPALQLAVASPAEAVPLVEYHMTLEPRRQRWLASPITPSDGRLEPPEAPGLGIELHADVLASASVSVDPGELWNRS